MGIYVVGAVGILVFYCAVLAVGIWAGTKQKNRGDEEVLLAGRSIGLAVGVLTLIATWVGGGYINGTAEAMFNTGLAWCQVPIGYSLSLLFGVMLFVKPMREENYFTMLDPFQRKYGNRIGALLYLPALLGDIVWVGAILNALGSSLVVILELDPITSVVVSAVFAAVYTMVGGLYSVTYTDVLQLACIIIGLLLSTPYIYLNPAVDPQLVSSSDWLGHIEQQDIGEWLDVLFLITFGGIPWQGYFQRILSLRSLKIAQILSIVGMFGCVAMAIAPAFIGVVAKGTDWSSVPDFHRNVTKRDAEIILPLALRFLTPAWVSFFGLGAITAAVMSSADSSILASSSMFYRNIYKLAFRPNASEREMTWVMRISVLTITALSTLIALTVTSVYYLSYVSSDLVYVILFPQLLLVVHFSKYVNSYGCIASYVVGMVLRLLGGEEGLGLPPLIRYPMYNEETGDQKFPFRTFAMLGSLVSHLLVSGVTNHLFMNRVIDPARWDILGIFNEQSSDNELPAISTVSRNVDDQPIIRKDELVSDSNGGVANPAVETYRSLPA
ncbi:high-affinity choline transporter 1-like [Anabrus simplex]|uniref:high-affinity choline transporter 1-like n=1 Tax=Anabrus simplex TaxID=316456 RepID=UPI0034DD5227